MRLRATSLGEPWNIPQSTITRAWLVLRRNCDPVTVVAAPTNCSFISPPPGLPGRPAHGRSGRDLQAPPPHHPTVAVEDTKRGLDDGPDAEREDDRTQSDRPAH